MSWSDMALGKKLIHMLLLFFLIVDVHFFFWNTSAYHQRALASRRGRTYCSLRTKPLRDLQISHFHFILPRVFEKEEECTFCDAPKLSVASCWSGARAPRRHFVISACEGCTCGAMTGQSANTLWFMGLCRWCACWRHGRWKGKACAVAYVKELI